MVNFESAQRMDLKNEKLAASLATMREGAAQLAAMQAYLSEYTYCVPTAARSTYRAPTAHLPRTFTTHLHRAPTPRAYHLPASCVPAVYLLRALSLTLT